jgi:hypothetical protein
MGEVTTAQVDPVSERTQVTGISVVNFDGSSFGGTLSASDQRNALTLSGMNVLTSRTLAQGTPSAPSADDGADVLTITTH